MKVRTEHVIDDLSGKGIFPGNEARVRVLIGRTVYVADVDIENPLIAPVIEKGRRHAVGGRKPYTKREILEPDAVPLDE